MFKKLTLREEAERKLRNWINKNKKMLIAVLEHKRALFIETGFVALKAEAWLSELSKAEEVINDLLEELRPLGEV